MSARSQFKAVAIPAGLMALGLVLVAASPSPEDLKAPDVGKSYNIPYRVTETNHFLVRVRINGKGPFNFLVDTGAPALYIGTEVAKTIGLETPKGEFWAPVERFEFEGGAVLKDVRGRIEDPFQLVGMNALGLPGASIDGILGYTMLARYKLEIDPTKDRMVWTRLDFEPKEPWVPKGATAKQMPAEMQAMNAMGGVAKFAAMFVGKQPEEKRLPQGFLGLEIEARGGHVYALKPLEGSAAEKAGLKPGDRILKIDGKKVYAAKDAHDAIAAVRPGAEVSLSLSRDEVPVELKATAGEGF